MSVIISIIQIVTIGILAILSFFLFYRFIFLIASFFQKQNVSLKKNPANYYRFAFLVPAHNEELLIEKTISSLKQIDYPSHFMEIFVIADNCTDDTAEIVRKNGVNCLERFDTVKRGKGYALNWALHRIHMEKYDAVVLLDADTLVNKEILQELNSDLQAGKKIIQGYHGVIHNEKDWLLNLAHLSDILQFYIHFTGKAILGMPVKLLGTGMCFTTEILQTYGWRSFSLTEDFEQYLKLVSSGEMIHFNPQVLAHSYQPSDLKNANSQRHRWIRGELEMAFRYLPRLLKDGIFKGQIKKIDAVLESVMPSFSSQFFLIFLALGGGVLSQNIMLIFWWCVLVVVTAIYVFAGLKRGQVQIYPFLKSLFFAPFYILWKMLVAFLSFFKVNKIWVRTPRS